MSTPQTAEIHSPGSGAEDEPRFAFGRNWRRFSEHLDDSRIVEAEDSLREMLGVERLDGRSFLDIGSGSGLSSLAAQRLGAGPIRSFDYDADSVACTTELRRRFAGGDENWTISPGDATDPAFVGSLGKFDVVYSYGVLHHTGQMWRGVDNACGAAGPGGQLWLSLYNDRGVRSHYWRAVKRTYSRFPVVRPFFIAWWTFLSFFKNALLSVIERRPADAITFWTRAGGRGMTGWHDLIDWVGGYPYEVAKPEQVIEFCEARGFRLQKLVTVNSLGNNDFIFVREREAS